MQGRCEIHPFDWAVDVCEHCLEDFCGECVVYPFGVDRLPLCKTCAVTAGGLRARTSRPKATRAQKREAMRRRAVLRQRQAS